MTMRDGVDGRVVLAMELDRWSSKSRFAAEAPRGKSLTTYLSRGVAREASSGGPGEAWWLTGQLLANLGIWWDLDGWRQLPVMTPWCIRDRSSRYDQGPEAWGSPRSDGFLRDDNSIIKKLPLPLAIRSGQQRAYDGRKPLRGFTACHIWRELEGGALGGEDPWIYSFMPNLVWLPTPLAALTDYNPHVKALLKGWSLARYERSHSNPSSEYNQYAWRLLRPPLGQIPACAADPRTFSEFRTDAAFLKRRIAYIDRFIEGADEVLRSGRLTKKLICTRYTQEFPQLSPISISEFRDKLADYRTTLAF